MAKTRCVSAEHQRLPEPVREWFETMDRRLQFEQCARELWNDVLSEKEKQRMGGNPKKALKKFRCAVGMWTFLHRTSRYRAIIEVLYRRGSLNEAQYAERLRQIGEHQAIRKSSPPQNTLHWNATTGELRCGKQVLRSVRLMALSSNVQRILDAFEKSKWPGEIKNPLPLPAGVTAIDQNQVKLAVQQLNRGLRGIRFHTARGGKAIRRS